MLNMENNFKKCSQCEEIKELSEFWKAKKSKDGKRSYCKVCGKKYNECKSFSKEDRTKYWKNRKERYKQDPEYHQQILDKRRQYTIDNPEKIMYGQARYRANKKGYEFTITPEDIKIPEFCPILGIKLNYGYGRTKGRDAVSLDRIDVNKGYTPDNIAVISDMANTMKNSATFEQLRMFADNIRKYIGDDIVHS